MSAPSTGKKLPGFRDPRGPRLARTESVDDLLDKARLLCRYPSRRMNMQPGYGLQPGERVLLGVDSSIDYRIVEALREAMIEAGAKVDTIIVDAAGAQRSVYYITPTPLDGADEARSVSRDIRSDVRRHPYLVREIADKHGYDLVINGQAGPIPDTPYRWERIPWTSLEHWASEEIPFPRDVQRAIDEVVWRQISQCRRVRITDPEGTEISFTNYDDGRWMYQSHQWGKPLYIGSEEDSEGVVAGTTNHRGVFPWCEATIERGLVTSVKGGGVYGDIWREKLEELRDVRFPAYDTRKVAGSRHVPAKHRPGFFWYWESAIGTMPKVFRPGENLFDLLYERRCAGLIHHGFGPNSDEIPEMSKAGLPTRHVHIHNLFATYQGTGDRGEPVVVVDRGRLTALDDPGVRAAAARFGDPDEILREAWIPTVPGINVDGDYMSLYGVDPRPLAVPTWARGG